MANINIELHRKVLAVGITLGVMLFGGHQYFSVEDQVRDLSNCSSTTCNGKINGVTAIPAGKYELTWTYSPKFKKNVLLVNNVPGFQGIRVHPGFLAGDRGDPRSTDGCLVLGLKGTEKGVEETTKAIEQFNKDVLSEIHKGNRVFIVITNDAPIVKVSK